MIKKVCSAFTAIIMVLALAVPAFALDQNQEIVDYGDGYYVIVTTTVERTTRANTVRSTKDATVYAGSTKIGTMTLVGNFTYTGTSATANSGSISGSGMNGWDYKSGYTTCSGNQVNGSAKFASGATAKTFDLTLTCSPSGVVS